MSARHAVELAIVDAVVLVVEPHDINIQRFWMTLHEAGYEVVPRTEQRDDRKRPPELSPAERAKRADRRDRGVLNDGDAAP